MIVDNPIIAPMEGDVFEFNDSMFGMRFIFKILEEHASHYKVLINNEKEDILYKNWELLEIFNTGLVQKIGRNNVKATV